jgi:putative ATP-binding cassette transporter
MRVLALLLRTSKVTIVAAFAVGALAGQGVGVLLALVHWSMMHGAPSLTWLVAFLAVSLAQLGLDLLSNHLLSRALHHDVLPAFREEIVRRFLAAPLRTVERIGPARLLGAVTEDVQQVAFASLNLGDLARNISAIAACLFFMLWLSPALFPVALGALAVGLALFSALSARARRSVARARVAQERAMVDVRAVLEGMTELKLDASARRRFMAEAFEPHVRESHRQAAQSGTVSAMAGSWISMVVLAAIGVVLFARWPGATASALAGYALALVYLYNELLKATNLMHPLRTGERALRAIETIADDNETEARRIPPPPLASWASVELDGVVHAYRRGASEPDFTLGPLRVTFRPGEIVFIAGGNGSGKSTFAKVLIGLYLPEEGVIRLDGKVIPVEEQETYRQLFSAVLSDSHVFERLYGLASDDLDAKANGYLADLRLAERVQVEKGAFSTIAVSQGQRRRLALVTALLEARPIYVFDEWAANQDPAFKEIFYTQVLPELRRLGKAVVVITHDDRYFPCADRIVRFEGGKIIEDAPNARAS